MLILTSKPVAAKIHENTTDRTRRFTAKYGRPPRLAVVLVGNDPASLIYTSKKSAAATAVGMEHETIQLPNTETPERVRTIIERLNRDPLVDGILIQRPLPRGFNEEEVLYWVMPEKDVDAFHPVNAGRLFLGLRALLPCTPSGVMAILEHYGLPVGGKVAAVIGRSAIVGKPMASLLLRADATVIQCHSRTQNLRELTRQAEILVVAAGKAEMIDASYVGKGAVVIDVGIHRRADGKVVGDVRFDDVAPICSAISPVPGGVGPMTIAMLLQNTVLAAELREEQRKH